jgi:hypothetical protein
VIDLAQVQFGTTVVDAQTVSDPDHPPQHMMRANRALYWRSVVQPEYPFHITLMLPLLSDVKRFVLEFANGEAPAEFSIWVSDSSQVQFPAGVSKSSQPEDPSSMLGFTKVADVNIAKDKVAANKPLVLPCTHNLSVRRIRIVIGAGNEKTGRVSIQRFSAFGSPALSTSNLSTNTLGDSRTIMALFHSVKSSLLYPLRQARL